jgi:hypothetical protein
MSTNPINITTTVDLSGIQKFTAGAKEAGSAAAEMAEKFMRSGLSAKEAASVLQNLGYSEEQAAEAAGVLATTQEAVAAATDKATESISRNFSAMGAAREEMGVLTNSSGMVAGGLARIAASSEILGPLIQAAFPAFAILGIIDLLSMVPTGIEKIIGAFTGWDEAAKKTYEDIVDQNRKLLVSADEISEHLKLAGAAGSLRAVGEASSTFQRQLAQATDELNHLEHGLTFLQALAAAGGFTGWDQQVSQLKQNIAGLTKEIGDLDTQQRTFATDAKDQAVEMQQARVEAEASYARAVEQYEAEIQQDRLRLNRITTEQYVAARKNSLEAEFAAETEAYEKLRALTEQKQAVTGQSQGAEISRMDEEQAQRRVELSRQLIQLEDQLGEAELKQIADVDRAMKASIDRRRSLLEEQTRLATEAYNKQEELAKQSLEAEIAGQEDQVAALKSGYETDVEALRGSFETKRVDLAQYVEAVRAASGEETTAVLLALEAEAAATRRAADAAIITEQEAARRIEEIHKQEAQVIAEDTKREVQATNQAAIQMQQSMQRYVSSVQSDFNRGLNEWLTGHKKFGQAMEEVWDSIAQKAIDSIAKIAENYALGLVLQQASQEKQVIMDAKTAAAQAFASAPNPIVGAVEAAATFASVTALYTPTFEFGGVVPQDMNALVHAGERVLTPMQNQNFERIANNSASSSTNISMENNFENHFHKAGDVNENNIAKMLQRAMRRGAISRRSL